MENLRMSKSIIILGAGYTARAVRPLAARQYARVLVTSREPDRHLSDIPSDEQIGFDLAQPDTWKNIPDDGDLLWCFPAEPIDQVQAFAATKNISTRRLVVLGSTSAYQASLSNEYPPPWIDETAPIDTSKPRVQGEEFLRTNCRAIILLVAGIYGRGRNPLDWIKNGRVGSSRKYVNLIHVEDLAEVCLTALERGLPGEAYNVSDGTPRTWEDICHTVQDRWGIEPVRKTADGPIGKRIAIGKLLAMLETERKALGHADLYRSLDPLHSERPAT
jgi:nucleoside-diphosphate-sugar epimerase